MEVYETCFKIALKSVLAHDRRTFQHLRNKVVKEFRKAKAIFFLDLTNDAKRKSREAWKNINKVHNKMYKDIELLFMEV